MKKELSLYERMPKKAKIDKGVAWWYASSGKIELYVQFDNNHFTISIPRAQLKQYIERTER